MSLLSTLVGAAEPDPPDGPEPGWWPLAPAPTTSGTFTSRWLVLNANNTTTWPVNPVTWVDLTCYR